MSPSSRFAARRPALWHTVSFVLFIGAIFIASRAFMLHDWLISAVAVAAAAVLWWMFRYWGCRANQDADTRVLEAIRQGAKYGFAICRATGLHAGRVYVSLARLERARLITSGWEADPGDRPPRRLYSLRSTDAS